VDNFNDEIWDYHTVTKLEAAQRQLDTAIELWFRDGDAVSIHTLVGAAYQILYDPNKKRGGPDVLAVDSMIPSEHLEEFRHICQEARILRRVAKGFAISDARSAA
jgi:hypothetical protein